MTFIEPKIELTTKEIVMKYEIIYRIIVDKDNVAEAFAIADKYNNMTVIECNLLK